MQLDDLDKAIFRILSEDARATYSEISKVVGVSVSTVRNRITSMRDSGALHLNVWLDPYRVGLGVTATFLLRVEPGRLDQVTEAVIALDETGYVAAIIGDHDLTVDAFCRDVPHLSKLVHNDIQPIEGVTSVTTYLVTDIKYESNMNLVSLLGEGQATEA